MRIHVQIGQGDAEGAGDGARLQRRTAEPIDGPSWGRQHVEVGLRVTLGHPVAASGRDLQIDKRGRVSKEPRRRWWYR